MFKSSKKRKGFRQTFAWILSLAMILSNFTGLQVSAAEDAGNVPSVVSAGDVSGGDASTYVFDAETDSVVSTLEKSAKIPEGKYGTDNYFTFTGSLKRGNSSTFSAELAKAETAKVSFTVNGSADASFTVTSTGGSNLSDFVLVDASGSKVLPKGAGEAVVVVTGTSPVTVIEYTDLAAGTYTIYAPEDGANNGRGFRLLKAVVKDYPVVVTTEYTFDAETDSVVSTLEKSAKIPEGKYGTDNYFTFTGSLKRGNSSTFSAELAKAETAKVSFTVNGSADASFTVTSTGGSNLSDFVLVDASGSKVLPKGAGEAVVVVTGTSPVTVIEYTDLAAGTYTIYAPKDGANNGRGFRLLKATVMDTTGGSRPERADWATVEAPVIVSAEQLTDKESKDYKDNTIEVKVTANVGYDGADKITVTMLDEKGNVVATDSSAEDGTEHVLSFNPTASGNYTFSVVAIRDGEEDKAGAETKTAAFVLKLEAPYVGSATNVGGGDVTVKWSSVAEATAYVVTVDGTDISITTSELSATVKGLTIGQKYTIKVVALRGEETSKEGSIEVNVVDEVQRTWSFVTYGSSTNTEKNGYKGNINEGSVTVYSEGGKGKIYPLGSDGLAFYYTEIDPETENFTLTATVNVDSWTFSNAQEGFGLMVSDTIGTNGDSGEVWNNSYMAVASKIEYYFDGEKVTTDSSYSKISMKIGLGTIARTGVTPQGIADKMAGLVTAPTGFVSESSTLESSAGPLGSGTYNLVGNYTKTPGGDLENLVTTFRLQIQRNNTGYILRYLDADDKVISEKLYYDLERTALTQLDEDTIYLGFFASRNARITVTDVELTTIHPDDDEAALDREIEYVYPVNTVESASFATSADYELVYYSNADGQLIIKDADGSVLLDKAFEALSKERLNVELKGGNNTFDVTFIPDPEYKPGEYKEMTSYETVNLTHNVEYKISNRKYVYVSPEGTSSAIGSKAEPMDIYTAVKLVGPGQSIVVKEGTYNLAKTVVVERGIDGTADNRIYMIADPEAGSRPVFDFNGNCAGMVLAGDYWYFQGFDVTESANAQKGIQVSGNNNVLDDLRTYRNGNTGIQVSRYKGTDEWEDWPANNLILNCTSYLNADAGYEDADGFAAKLTVADGNVFDGCIAAYNADDGWDLFAKAQTGSIGVVVIKNSIAFMNGYTIDKETGAVVNAGNGNGFKMGGESLPGAHRLINSIAFANKAKGIDSNSGPNIQVYDCTSFDNENYNVAFYTNSAVNTAYIADGIISYKVSNSVEEQIKEKGTQVSTDIYGSTNYYFKDGKFANADGAQVTSDWFVNLDTTAAITGITRNADKTINMNGYLVLTDVADSNAGARMTGTPSAVFTITDENGIVQTPTPETTPAPVVTAAPSTDGDKDDKPTTTPTVEEVVKDIASATASAANDILNADSWEEVKEAISTFVNTVLQMFKELPYVSVEAAMSLSSAEAAIAAKGAVLEIDDSNAEKVGVTDVANGLFTVPEGGRFVVKDTTLSAEQKKAAMKCGISQKQMENAYPIDMGLFDKNNNAVQPLVPMVVTFKLPDVFKGKDVKLLHYAGDKVEVIEVEENGSVGRAVVSGFSTFALIEVGDSKAPKTSDIFTPQVNAPIAVSAEETGSVLPWICLAIAVLTGIAAVITGVSIFRKKEEE